MATVNDLATVALKEIGVLAAGEVPTAGEAEDARLALNRLVDQWAAERLQIYAVTRTTATLTASQASFTVGTGGNINIARPVYIEKVNFIDTSPTPDIEYPLPPLLTERAWQDIREKALTATYPTLAYYSPTYPTGTLYPWPIPTSATLQWAVYAWTAVTSFAAITTSVALPPGYEELIVTSLAVRLATPYGRGVDPSLFGRSVEAKAIVKRANQRLVELQFPADALIGNSGGSGWSILTGP